MHSVKEGIIMNWLVYEFFQNVSHSKGGKWLLEGKVFKKVINEVKQEFLLK